MSTATATRPNSTQTKTYSFEELALWSIIEVEGKCYRKQNQKPSDNGTVAHNMNAACGGPLYVVWSEFRPHNERYVDDGFGSYEIAK
jgi:hypothetical protein